MKAEPKNRQRGKMLNLGPASTRWLEVAGVCTLTDLRKTGSVEAWWRVQEAGFNPSLNLLYALEGALRGEHWAELSATTKRRLKKAIESRPA